MMSGVSERADIEIIIIIKSDEAKVLWSSRE
jgi:hypothetical protein